MSFCTLLSNEIFYASLIIRYRINFKKTPPSWVTGLSNFLASRIKKLLNFKNQLPQFGFLLLNFPTRLGFWYSTFHPWRICIQPILPKLKEMHFNALRLGFFFALRKLIWLYLIEQIFLFNIYLHMKYYFVFDEKQSNLLLQTIA